MKANNIRFGIAGTGKISGLMIKGAARVPGFEAAAVFSRTKERGEAFASEYGIPHVYTSLEEMVSGNDIDAVYIATPNYAHCRQSIVCMVHGKHVLCEKPLSVTRAEAEEMIKVARDNGVVLMEAMKSTLSDGFRAIADNLWQIGRPRRYFASYCQYSSRYDSYKEGIVLNAFRSDLGNGAAMDIGVYTIYPMVALFGEPQSVYSSSVMLESGVDGQGSAIFSYPGMQADVIYSKISDSSLPSEIQGEDGSLLIERINTIGRVILKKRGKDTSVIYEADPSINEYGKEMEEFIRLINEGKRESAVNSHANSLITISLLEKIRGHFVPKILSPASPSPGTI